MTSRNPLVVTSAALGNLRVMSAFVATVVPCEKSSTSERSMFARLTPLMTAVIGLSGVDGTFVTRMDWVDSSKMQMSVNVPPTSTATRRLATVSPSISVICTSSWPARRARSMEDLKDHGPGSCGVHKVWEKLLVGAVARHALVNRGASCERSGGASETRRSWMNSREQVFETLLTSLGADAPLGSVVAQAGRICHGSALVVNELGETLRTFGAAPGHLVSDWVLAHVFAGSFATGAQDGTGRETEMRQGQIGRWGVSARIVRIRQRVQAIVIAIHEDSGATGSAGGTAGAEGEDAELVLDTVVKILRAFEGFESFSMSTRREESARAMRELEAGIAPGREPAKWRTLENFGFEAYAPVRVVRARSAAGSGHSAEQPTAGPTGSGPASQRHTNVAVSDRTLTAMKGIVLSDSGVPSSLDEMTALCAEDFPIE